MLLHARSPRRLPHLFPPNSILSSRINFSNLLHTQTVSNSSSLPYLDEQLENFFNYVLQDCTKLPHLRQLHAQVILSGTHRSAFLSARLVSVYSRFSFNTIARMVFESASLNSRSNLLLWNSIIRANVRHEDWEEALRIYSEMRQCHISEDGFTFPLIIKACGSTGNVRMCRNVHGRVLQMGFKDSVHVCHELIGMYGKIGEMGNARKVFDRMADRSILSWNVMFSGFALNWDCDGTVEMFRRMELEGWKPNVVTWTSVLSSYKRCGRGEETIEMFGLMRSSGIGVNAEAVAVVLSVCADLGEMQKGMMIHGFVVKGGLEGYLSVSSSLISVYGKCGDVKTAESLFLGMETKNLESWNSLISSYAECGFCDEAFAVFSKMGETNGLRPNVVSWSALINGFASMGRGEESLELFRQMQFANVLVNPVTICSVLSVCADLAALPLGREIHGYLVRLAMDSNVLVGNSLISMYSKCGSLIGGRLVFERIQGKDIISWNSIIDGYGMHGLGELGLKTFNQMIQSGGKPDQVTFIAVLSACSHAGLVAEGRNIFYQMDGDFKIKPQMEHYACFVDLLGRGGYLQEAMEVLKSVPMEPNICLWGALLNACRMHKNTELAKEIGSRISDLKSETTGSYMLLSNIYAANRRWDDSAKARILARGKGKKVAGQSWIEVKKKVYMFQAGKIFQEGLDNIYAFLKDLTSRLEIEGYVPDKSFVLQDVDEEEKNQILVGHSEKLAIAFGHVNLPLSMPIRIMKNLRVCGDCHNWTKFFSKVTGREVIVRDGRRFHHFANGSCTCNDYW